MSDMPCGHDSKYGLMLLPPEAKGCLACAYEQAMAKIKELEAEVERQRKENHQLRSVIAASDIPLERVEIVFKDFKAEGDSDD